MRSSIINNRDEKQYLLHNQQSSSNNNNNNKESEDASIIIDSNNDPSLDSSARLNNDDAVPTSDNAETSSSKKNFFTAGLVLFLLVCLSVPLYFLVRHAHFEFDYHKECVTCFDGKADFEVIFNQTNGTCDLFVENATYDSNDIVLDPNFCGAPHCQNLELLPGVRLVPYWAVVLTAIFSIVLSTGVNVIKYNCYLPIKRKFYKWKWDKELVEENPLIRLGKHEDEILERARELPDNEERTRTEKSVATLRHTNTFMKTIGFTDPYFFCALYVYAFFHFLLTFHTVISNPTFAHLDGWHQYQAFYALFLNSGSLQVIVYPLCMMSLAGKFANQAPVDNSEEHSVVAELAELLNDPIVQEIDSKYYDHQKTRSFVYGFPKLIVSPLAAWRENGLEREELGNLEAASVSLAFLIVAPFVLTHSAPGSCVFSPYVCALMLGALAVAGMVYAPVYKICGKNSSMGSWILLVIYRLVGNIMPLVFGPIVFNYSVLLYEGRTWSDIMTGEYRLRNTDCYFNAIVNSLQIYNIGFVGLIFS